MRCTEWQIDDCGRKYRDITLSKGTYVERVYCTNMPHIERRDSMNRMLLIRKARALRRARSLGLTRCL